MSKGDIIQCNSLDELLTMHEQLCKAGYVVDFDYSKGKMAVLTIEEVPGNDDAS